MTKWRITGDYRTTLSSMFPGCKSEADGQFTILYLDHPNQEDQLVDWLEGHGIHYALEGEIKPDRLSVRFEFEVPDKCVLYEVSGNLSLVKDGLTHLLGYINNTLESLNDT